ncbi:hypothetical protein ZWY2020_055449, partial [Hordeum vulgare]
SLQILPSLSRSTSLKTLVLDGCVGLEHGDSKEAKITRISMAGCARLFNFMLCGSLPNLEELDLSSTRVKTLDLRTQMVQVPCLQQVFLLKWKWPSRPACSVGGWAFCTLIPRYSLFKKVDVTIMDMRLFQSLVLQSNAEFSWKSDMFHLNLYVPCTTNVKRGSYMKENMVPGNRKKTMGPSQPKSLTLKSYRTLIDVSVGNIIIDLDYYSGIWLQPPGCHVEIVIEAIIFAMNEAKSLHVHENSSITIVIRGQVISKDLRWEHLKLYHVVRCPKMHIVFTTKPLGGDDLPMARCIWSKGRTFSGTDTYSFGKPQRMHMYSCSRLTFVLPLLWTIQRSYLANLESLHIVHCGDVMILFPVHPGLEGVLEFPSLKHIHLYELCKLQHICEVKLLAPKPECLWLRGCWDLKRVLAIHGDSRPIEDCKKNWWEKL